MLLLLVVNNDKVKWGGGGGDLRTTSSEAYKIVLRALSEKFIDVRSTNVPMLLVYESQEDGFIKMLSTTQKDFSMEAAVLNSASARNESCYSQLFQQRYHLRMLAA